MMNHSGQLRFLAGKSQCVIFTVQFAVTTALCFAPRFRLSCPSQPCPFTTQSAPSSRAAFKHRISSWSSLWNGARVALWLRFAKALLSLSAPLSPLATADEASSNSAKTGILLQCQQNYQNCLILTAFGTVKLCGVACAAGSMTWIEPASFVTVEPGPCSELVVASSCRSRMRPARLARTATAEADRL